MDAEEELYSIKHSDEILIQQAENLAIIQELKVIPHLYN